MSSPPAHLYRVLHGGSWASVTQFAPAACCDTLVPSFRDSDLGLRLLRRRP